ncbi:hypothetical protein [Petroclostridium sp. X23]|uniref:hypothetical protein n=1 Tax=Petroclostridium sp. X23 TaxID=3045146 RepID=UPI0024AD2181|nr:hypothetical protein [Petroclostridium sp. X23]WHH58414.1 hypothetical protein QKW49_21845 [Petroclostridium sp. X23]
MFEIRFRIVDDFIMLRQIETNEFDMDGGDVEGFFSLNFNGNIEGYYHDNPLGEDETGQELLTLWFDLLIDTIIQLEKSKYAALKIIETFDSWIEFTLIDNKLNISFAKLKDELSNDYIIGEPKYSFVYPEWRNVEISFNSFKQEVKDKAKGYLNIIRELNPQLLNSRIISKLAERIKLV